MLYWPPATSSGNSNPCIKFTCTKVWKRESFFWRDLMTSRAKGWLLQKVAVACFSFSSAGPLNCARKPRKPNLDRLSFSTCQFQQIYSHIAEMVSSGKKGTTGKTREVTSILFFKALSSQSTEEPLYISNSTVLLSAALAHPILSINALLIHRENTVPCLHCQT